MYGIEREYKESRVDARHLAPQKCSVPALAELQAWLQKTQPLVTPKSALGTALAYMGNLWSQLTVCTQCGDLLVGVDGKSQ